MALVKVLRAKVSNSKLALAKACSTSRLNVALSMPPPEKARPIKSSGSFV